MNNLKQAAIAALVLVTALFAATPVSWSQSRTESRKSSADVKRSVNELSAKVSRAVVELQLDDRAVALGTIISDHGLLVTKASEIHGDGELTCRLWDLRQFTPEIVGEDESLDLALLRIPATGLEPVDLSTDRHPTAGSFLVSVGLAGQTIGLSVTEVDTRKFNLRHARPSERGYLGINCSPVKDQDGLLVQQVTSDSAARRAGIRNGDVIISINDRSLSLVEHLVRELRRHKVGEQVQLIVRRGQEQITVQATLGKAPTFEPTDQWGGGPFSKRRFGFETVIVHDAPLEPSECGGPLLDTDGRVVGINIARALRVASYALPVEVVRDFVQSQWTETNELAPAGE